MPYKWGKLLINLNNAVGAITNARGSDNECIARAARQEAESILAKAGIHWESVLSKDLVKQWPEIVGQPSHVIKLEAQSSTWQSLARQQGTVEADLLNGEIVRVAERLGIRAPVNENLLSIVQQMAASHELPGKYTPAELCRLVGLEPVMPPAL
jgi:2-dehydropantoate 2-reductase